MVALYRYRERGSLNGNVTITQDAFPQSCANRVVVSPYDSHTSSFYKTGKKEYILDYSEQGYARARKKGAIILHPYARNSHSIEVIGNTSITHTTVADSCFAPNIKAWYNDKGAYFAFLIAYVTPPLGPGHPTTRIDAFKINALQNEAITEALAKRQQGKSNYLESLAEADQAFHLVLNPLENVNRFLDSFTRRKRKRGSRKEIARDGREVFRFAGSEYLRFRYGIRPLMSDVKAAMTALKNGYNRKPAVHRSRGSASDEATSVKTGSFILDAYNVSYQIASRKEVSAKAVFYDQYIRTVWDDLGVNLQNLLGLPWELLRYSFVIDWFANVGDLIYANLPRVRLNPVGGCVTVANKQVTVWSPTGVTNALPATWTISGSISDQVKEETVDITRRLFGENDSALVIKSDFRFDVWTRALDAAALVNQKLSRIHFG